MLSNPPAVIRAILLLIALPAAYWDIRARRIPNWLSAAGVLAGIGLNSFLYGMPGLWMSMEGIGLAFSIYFPLYLLHGMGAGDVKLMAAIGAIAGWQNWLAILVLTSAFGALVAAILVTQKGLARTTLYNIALILLNLRSGVAPYRAAPHLDVCSDSAVRLPHAAAIAFGSAGFLLAAQIWAPK